MREYLSGVLESHKNITVVGTAKNAAQAREVIRDVSPDVITLDIQMSEMDGIEFLEKIMKFRPMPVVMVSGQSRSQADLALRSLEMGAVGLIAKPQSAEGRKEFCKLLCAAVVGANQARLDRDWPNRGFNKKPATESRLAQINNRRCGYGTACEVIAIGASTGGVTSISHLLAQLRLLKSIPPTVIAQHMPREFTASFAHRLSRKLRLDVLEAVNDEVLLPNSVRIAPGGKHLRILRHAGRLICSVTEDAPINNHRPSVDELFSSVAACSGQRSIGVILTGMGKDGAHGLLQMRQSGAYTLGESQSSCVVYGMPAAAKRIGAVTNELDITDLSTHLSAKLLPHQSSQWQNPV